MLRSLPRKNIYVHTGYVIIFSKKLLSNKFLTFLFVKSLYLRNKKIQEELLPLFFQLPSIDDVVPDAVEAAYDAC